MGRFRRPLAVLALLAVAAPACRAQCDDQSASVPFIARGGLSLSEGVRQAAAELSSKEPGAGQAGSAGTLGFSWNQKFNPRYWKSVDSKTGTWALQDKECGKDDGAPVNAAQAVLDILRNSGEYSIECATAIKFVLYIGLIKNIGGDRFNAAAKSTPLKIGYGRVGYESLLSGVMKRQLNAPDYADFPGMASPTDCASSGCQNSSGKRNDSVFIDSNLQAGDAVYIVNLWPTSKAYQGENSLFLGGGQFFGHPFGVKSEAEIMSELAAYWNREPADSTIPLPGGKHVPNGPPGLVYDFFRPDTGAVNALGN